MHFSFLLTALLFALAQVEAAPVKRSSRMVTLSLKRLPQSSDVPPNIVSATLAFVLKEDHHLSRPTSFYNSTSTVATVAMRA